MKTKTIHHSFLFRILALAVVALTLSACNNEKAKQNTVKVEKKQDTYEDTLKAQKDSLDINSDYDMETVDRKHQKEFMENLAKIEDKYGTQWDFCTCVIKNDSVNKAFMDESLSDAEMDRLFARSEAIDNKCQAFLVQSPNQTPEERYKHNKKVDACLKEAGLK